MSDIEIFMSSAAIASPAPKERKERRSVVPDFVWTDTVLQAKAAPVGVGGCAQALLGRA